jgi:dTDP-glucose 4,6-dehydratase
MRILLTGAAGFIGSNFARMIARGEFEEISSVYVLDKLTYAGLKKNLKTVEIFPKYEFFQGDICDSKLVQQLLCDVDAVVNFAAESHVDRSISGAADFVRTNAVGVQVLLDEILATRRNIRFLQVSTDEVYGSIDQGSWNETCPILPNSPYSASKGAGELLVRAFHNTHGVDTVITRCSNNYGPFHFPEKLIPLFITNLILGLKLPVYGNGKNVRDWLHVDDHCRGIYKVLIGGRSGEIYNIGGGREVSNIELTKIILDFMDLDESYIDFVQDRKGHDFRYSVNWSKINQELGYEPKIKFENGLIDTIKWYKENRDWWEPLKNN